MAVGSGGTTRQQDQAAAVVSSAADGRTPLHLVTSVTDAEHLIRCGADLHQPDAFGMSPLHLAAARGDPQVCRLLLKHEPSLVSAVDHAGNTPLYWSTRSVDIVTLLLEHGADPDARNHAGETAAMRACLQGRTDIVRLLLNKISDVDAKDNEGKTMLMIASQHGFYEIAELLLQRGAVPDRRDLAGWTPLHFAALGAWPQHESHPKLMRLLLMHGADPNVAETSCHWQPLHVSTDASAVRVLHEFGADVNALDSSGRTPAHHLNAEAVAELQRCGAQLDVADRYGRTPLHHVASVEKAVTLCAFGANVNALDEQGKTPLDWAQHRPFVADALKARGAVPGSSSSWPFSYGDVVLLSAIVEREPVAAQQPQQAQQRRPRRGLQDMMERDQPQQNARPRIPQEPPKPTKYEEKMAAKEASRIAQEEAEEKARRNKLKAEQEKMEQEFEQWKDLIVEEEKGSLETDNAMNEENLLEKFLQEILNRKIVAIEDLVAKFELGSAQNCLDRIKFLEDSGRLSGIMDDRGKYVFVSAADLDRVAEYITDKGRVGIRDVIAACNRIIDVTPIKTVDTFSFDSEEERQEEQI